MNNNSTNFPRLGRGIPHSCYFQGLKILGTGFENYTITQLLKIMNRFYTFTFLLLALFYASCAVSGISQQFGIIFWGAMLTAAGMFLIFFILSRPPEEKK